MPDLIISKFTGKPGELEQALPKFQGIPMQIGFYNPKQFFEYDHKGLLHACRDNDIDIKSIHAPTIDIFEEERFFDMLRMIRQDYGVDNITLHPSSGNPFDAYKLYEKHMGTLKDIGIYPLYENFDSSKNKRWLPNAGSIFRVPISNIYLTYDTSHVKIGTNIVDQLEEYSYRLGMVHLSNRKRKGRNHMPIFEGDHNLAPVIEHLKHSPAFVALEYHNADDSMIEDYKYLKNEFKDYC